jgi:threonine synthase
VSRRPAAPGEVRGLESDGDREEILAAQRTLARTERIWAGPTGVATLAVLEKLVATKTLDGAQDICVVVSETGLKTEAELPSRAGIAFDEPSLRRLVAGRLGTRS